MQSKKDVLSLGSFYMETSSEKRKTSMKKIIRYIKVHMATR